MDTIYRIVINVKTLQGPKEIGDFEIEGDKDQAYALFNTLKGVPVTDDESPVLRMDLVEGGKNEPELVLKSLSCTLDQYAENSKIIVREIFKFLSLEN